MPQSTGLTMLDISNKIDKTGCQASQCFTGKTLKRPADFYLQALQKSLWLGSYSLH
jgi:hypothetical protein